MPEMDASGLSRTRNAARFAVYDATMIIANPAQTIPSTRALKLRGVPSHHISSDHNSPYINVENACNLLCINSENVYNSTILKMISFYTATCKSKHNGNSHLVKCQPLIFEGHKLKAN